MSSLSSKRRPRGPLLVTERGASASHFLVRGGSSVRLGGWKCRPEVARCGGVRPQPLATGARRCHAYASARRCVICAKKPLQYHVYHEYWRATLS
jgi:hypothetical protein